MTIERHEITDRASWLALRMQDLTASDVGAVAGVDSNRTPLKVYAEKTGMIGPTPDNGPMARGRWFEPAILEALREKHPTWDIRRAGVYLRDPEVRLGATPDFVAIDPEREGIGAIQGKIVAKPIFESEWPDRRAPLKFELQTLAEAMLLEAGWAMVAAIVVDTYTAELVEHAVPRHDGAEARICQMSTAFWSNVATGQPPPPVYSQDAELITALHPKGGGPAVDLSKHNRIAFLCDERLAWQRRKSASEGALEVVDAEIKAILGNADEGLHPRIQDHMEAAEAGRGSDPGRRIPRAAHHPERKGLNRWKPRSTSWTSAKSGPALSIVSHAPTRGERGVN
jgi:predicted phage-related endonuclease